MSELVVLFVELLEIRLFILSFLNVFKIHLAIANPDLKCLLILLIINNRDEFLLNQCLSPTILAHNFYNSRLLILF